MKQIKLLVVLLLGAFLLLGCTQQSQQAPPPTNLNQAPTTPPISKQEMSQEKALELANSNIQPPCNITYSGVEKVSWSKGGPAYSILKDTICSEITDYNYSEVWEARASINKDVEVITFVGLYGEFTCSYALDHRAGPGIEEIGNVC